MEEKKKLRDEELQTYIEGLLSKAKVAQKTFERNYLTNRSVDEVLRAIGMATCANAEELCRDAIAETGMGNLKGKVQKLTSCALSQWATCKGQNTIDYEDCPNEPGVKRLPKPMGVIGAVMPSTNPVATIIGNSMMALKGRNAIIIAPHPKSVDVSEKLVNILRAALKEVGAPEDLIQTINSEAASIEATTLLVSSCDCNLATGGAAMVKACYSSGKPAIGVGQGNTQEIIDRGMTDEEWEQGVKDTIICRTFDNGVPCTGTQTDHVPVECEEMYLRLMKENKAYVVNEEEKEKLRELAFPGGRTAINRAIVGKLPHEIGKLAGIDVPEDASVILVKNQAWGDQDVLCREILCPIIRYTTYEVFEDAVARAVETLEVEGAGHSACIWSHDEEHIEYTAKRVPVGRFHINQPTQGKSNGLIGSITVGCGTWGGSSVSENVTFRHLLNMTKVTTVVPNVRPRIDVSWDDFEPFNPLKD